MNWFIASKGQDGKIIHQAFVVLKKPAMTKLAYRSREHLVNIAKQNNEDGVSCKVNLIENKNKIEINVNFINDIWAFPMYTEVWVYPKEEMKRAVKSFNRIVNVLEDLKTDAEDDELPAPSVQGKAREELRYIDVDRKKPVNNPSQKAARSEPGEADWRNSLYGNRYPQQIVNINNNGQITITNGG